MQAGNCKYRSSATNQCNTIRLVSPIYHRCMRPQVSCNGVISVPAAWMEDYQYLSDFGYIVDLPDRGHSMSEVAIKYGFSRTTIPGLYRGYLISDKTPNLRHQWGRTKVLKERNHRWLETSERHRRHLRETCNTFSNWRGIQCWCIGKCRRANCLTDHLCYGLSELKAYSCTAFDCMV